MNEDIVKGGFGAQDGEADPKPQMFNQGPRNEAGSSAIARRKLQRISDGRAPFDKSVVIEYTVEPP